MSDMWEYFKCQQCGACCRDIGLPYDANSVHKMADLFKVTVKEVIEKYYGRTSPDGSSWVWESEDSKRTPCPFLKFADGKYLCEIYFIRPLGCRAYPMYTDGGRQGVDCPAAKIIYDNLEKDMEKANEKARLMSYRFDFKVISPKKKDKLFTPYGHIYLKSYSEDKQGDILLSPTCIDENEIDEQISFLIADLEKVRK